MKHFRLMQKDIDVAPFMGELAAHQKPWSSERARAIPLHRDTLAIHLRIATMDPIGTPINEIQKDHKTEDYVQFPQLTAFLESFASRVRGSLARITIVSLKPNSQVYAHKDNGTYYDKRDRYHLVLQSPSGSKMLSGGEECIFQKGELWWFDNKAIHEAFNPSDGAERIHVIFDVLPNKSFLARIFSRS